MPNDIADLDVDWPEQAASWLRQARAFAASDPDAWVVFDTPRGWAQMSRRLRHSTSWDPARTVGSGGLADIELLELAGDNAVGGMRGATHDGRRWMISGGMIVYTAISQ